MSVFEGMRRLRGAPGTKISITVIRGSAADPHVIELTREVPPTTDVTGRIAAPGVGYLRVTAVGPRTAEQAKARIADLVKGGASKLIVDIRRASGGSLDGGIALARLFVGTGTLTVRETRGADKVTMTAASGDGSVTLPTTLLIDTGTSGGAELFAASLLGNSRAESIGERTIGRAATPETGSPAGRQRTLAHDDTVPHTGRHAAARKGPRADRRGRRTGRGFRRSRRPRPTRSSTRRSSGSRQKKAA